MEPILGNYLLAQLSFSDSTISFILNEHHKLDQYQKRTRNISHRIYDQDQQITVSFNLGTQALITHFIIEFVENKQFTDILQFLFAESISITDSNQYKKMINTSSKLITQNNIFTIHSLAYTKVSKLTFLLKQQFINDYLNLHEIKMEKQKNSFEQGINLLLKSNLKKIQIWGYPPNISPAATHVPQLLNISHLFKKCSRQQQAIQTDILLGLCLINARRFNQASELLKKVSANLIKKYQSSKNVQIMASTYNQNKKQFSVQYDRKSKIKNNDSQIFFFNSTNCPNLLNNNKKSLIRAAKIELLIADTINHPSNVSQKVLAYCRATTYFTGSSSIDNNLKSYDIYTALLTLCPNLIRFLIKTLYDKFQPLKITAIKSLEFLLQSLGCSVGNYLPQLLKSIISTYPSLFQNNISYTPLSTPITIGIGYEQGSRQKPINMVHNTKLVIDHYHHLLESFLNLIPSLSKNISRIIFQQIILPNIFLPEINNEIRFYVFRISQKIISVCMGDLDIPMSFLINILNMSEGKGILFPKDKNNSALIYHSQKIWQLLKTKIICNSEGIKLVKLSQWINETMVFFCENQFQTISQYSFQQILELINIVYSKNTNQILIYPLQPLLYFLNMSLNQNTLPFEKILNTLITLLKFYLQKQKDSMIINQIIEKIVIKSTISSLSLKQLKVFLEILKLYKQAETQWLQKFLNCIPHSTFDETFIVFDLLLQNCKDKIDKPLFLRIINTLLDQYTVKGKAHKKTKQLLTEIIINNKIQLFSAFIDICIIQNQQPNTSGKTLNKIKVKKFDSKLYNKAVELFTQKLSFACQLFVHIKLVHLDYIISDQKLKQFEISLIQLLNSKNSKNRIKSINLIKNLIDCYENNHKNNKIINQKTLKFTKIILTILKIELQQFKDSKMQFNALYLIYRIFSKILITKNNFIKKEIKEDLKKINQNDFASLDLSKQINFQLDDLNYLNLRIRQILKLWPTLITYITSPWSFIRQIFCILISQFFLVDLNYYKNCYKKKLLELIRPILSNLLISNEYCDRYYGLKIFGKIIGMAGQYDSKNCISIFRANSCNFGDVVEIIKQLENDWDQNIKNCAIIINQLGISKQLKRSLRRRKNSQKRSINNLMSNSFFSFNISDQIQFQQRDDSQTLMNLSQNIQNFLKQTQNLMQSEMIKFQQNEYDQEERLNEIVLQAEDQTDKYWLQQQSWQNIKKYLQIFTRKDQENLVGWNEKNISNQIVNQQQDNFFAIHEEDIQNLEKKQINKTKDEQQQLDFQDLGIIQIDDQQWNDYQSQVKIVQKLPLKRKYKLSPNLGASNKIEMIQSQSNSSKKIVDQKQSQTLIPQIIQQRINVSKNENIQTKTQEFNSPQQSSSQIKQNESQEEKQQFEQIYKNNKQIKKKKNSKAKKQILYDNKQMKKSTKNSSKEEIKKKPGNSITKQKKINK